MKKLFLILSTTILLNGCSDIDTVKNGTLNNYKSTTIGDAFDNYSYALKPKWDSFKTKNGQRIVDVSLELKFPPIFCNFTSKDKHCNSIEGLQTFLGLGFGMHVYPEWNQKVADAGKSDKCKMPEAYSGNINIQFLINKNNTFETSHVGLEYLIQDKKTKDCKYLTTAQVLINKRKGLKLYKSILDAIYEDNPIY